jgi:SEC-C motif-containing protein
VNALACPCGGQGQARPTGRPELAPTLAACCGRYHLGLAAPEAPAQTAPTPEALMRSRYSAFVLDRRAHLLATWHPDVRPDRIEAPEPGLKWLGLSVSQSATHPLAQGAPPPAWAASLSGPPLQAWGEVRFVARSRLGGRAHRLAEHSGFVLQGGHWLYVCALPA